jgi:imidazolonepropionase-like amidohydrolase
LTTPPNSPGDYLALVGATIYVSPGREPIRDGVVLIRGEKMVSVGARAQMQFPETARALDCFGLTITAGFWNSHVHFFERKWSEAATIPAPELTSQLQNMLTQYGFTSVFDIGSSWENTRRLRDRIDSGEIPGPRIRSTGPGLVPPGALPSDQVIGLMGLMKFPAPEIANALEAADAAKKLLDQGVDAIKLFASSPRSPSLSESTIEAAASEAQRANKPVFIHPNTGADVLTAVRAGVEIIAHTTPHTGPWDDTLLTAMKHHRVALTPTLTLWKYYMRHDRLSLQEKVTHTEIGQLRAWAEAGGEVLFGTDLGAIEYDPTEEYVLMSRAGMTFPQILACLTSAPAGRFGDQNHLGQVVAGLEADLTVLEGNPATDIRALAQVKYTLRAGKIIYARPVDVRPRA